MYVVGTECAGVGRISGFRENFKDYYEWVQECVTEYTAVTRKILKEKEPQNRDYVIDNFALSRIHITAQELINQTGFPFFRQSRDVFVSI